MLETEKGLRQTERSIVFARTSRSKLVLGVGAPGAAGRVWARLAMILLEG